jgi:uncharacterized Zn finger protein
MTYDYRDYPSYPVTRPRKAKGGIRARSKRGAFGEKWWGKRWIEFLESSGADSRMSRGRSYARQGQVLGIDVMKGQVTARVQGSRVRPYRVKIRIETLTTAHWQEVAALIAGRPALAARLLAGEMPEEIDDLFTEAGLSLFPSDDGDLVAQCSCPDWSNPCKHIAAVYYLLGEEFDRDPFLVFRLRGIERQEFMGLVGGASAASARKSGPDTAVSEERGNGGKTRKRRGRSASASLKPDTLPSDSVAFWGTVYGTALEAGPEGEVRVPLMPAILPKRLGGFPFWRGQEDFIAALELIYRAASAVGLDVFLGEPMPEPEEGGQPPNGPTPRPTA